MTKLEAEPHASHTSTLQLLIGHGTDTKSLRDATRDLIDDLNIDVEGLMTSEETPEEVKTLLQGIIDEHREAELLILNMPGVGGFYGGPNDPSFMSKKRAEVMKSIIENSFERLANMTPEEIEEEQRQIFSED